MGLAFRQGMREEQNDLTSKRNPTALPACLYFRDSDFLLAASYPLIGTCRIFRRAGFVNALSSKDLTSLGTFTKCCPRPVAFPKVAVT